LWHLPQFAVIGTYRDFGPVGYLGMFLGLTCGAIVLTWLYNRSGGSILLVIVWHGVMFWYQSDRRPKFKPTTTVSSARNARTGVWRTMPDLRPVCSRSANAA
jgi:hypothetical protein